MQFHTTGIVLAALTVVSAASAQSTQAVEWKVSEGGNGHWYACQTFTPSASWQAMRAAAEAVGAHLGTIQTAEENSFVFNLSVSAGGWNGRMGPRLGARKLNGCSGMQWVTGEAFGYANWLPGEPNGGCGEPALGFIGVIGSEIPSDRWNDYPDSGTWQTNSVIFEWESDCNGDGIVDYGQIRSGALADVNDNNVPDSCESFISGVLPVSGPVEGGTIIAIIGSNLPESPVVLVGGLPATNVIRVSSSRITAVTPANLPGNVVISVGELIAANAFYYRPECGSDLDQNGVVDAGDISIILLDFGPCYQAPLATAAPEVPPLLDAQALPDAPRQR